MLFWILVIYVARWSGTTRRHPDHVVRVPSDTLCDSTINNCWTLFDIVWGCLATTSACTWVALHQNIPDPKLGWLSLLLRKLRIMLVMIIAPEFIMNYAAVQLISALRISKELDVSKTHGFFCAMGGFTPQEKNVIADVKQLPVYISAIQAVEEADITDRSKADALSKGVAIAQALWFVTQYVARVSQRLPVTELEVAPLSFAILSIFIRLLWWWKPLDVQRSIVVVRPDTEVDSLHIQEGYITTRTDTPHVAVDFLSYSSGGLYRKTHIG
ncbi:hypothetical protein B0H16DRAFT_1429841 [Mycena metata]|uniref:Uncharacterized protein n=1 Tax=Mycena metata TaxID=1033252 RepID=A0AAD7HPZ4_9AGAR|nr:hypothetical protein B0H16DRAFT_1429841 [Mycena metata]